MRSSWNGQRPTQRDPWRRRSVWAETTSTMSAACLTRSRLSSEINAMRSMILVSREPQKRASSGTVNSVKRAMQ